MRRKLVEQGWQNKSGFVHWGLIPLRGTTSHAVSVICSADRPPEVSVFVPESGMACAVPIRRTEAFYFEMLRIWFRIPEYPSCPFFCLYAGRTRPMFTPTQKEPHDQRTERTPLCETSLA